MYIKTIDVNELDAILQKYFKCKDVFINVVEVAGFRNQYAPIKHEIGAGGVCNITFETSKKIKGAVSFAQ